MANESQRRKVVETSHSSGACVECFTEYILIKTQDADSVISQGQRCAKKPDCAYIHSYVSQGSPKMHLIDGFIQPILTEISPVQILIKEIISKFSGLSFFYHLYFFYLLSFYACNSLQSFLCRLRITADLSVV